MEKGSPIVLRYPAQGSEGPTKNYTLFGEKEAPTDFFSHFQKIQKFIEEEAEWETGFPLFFVIWFKELRFLVILDPL